MKTLRTGREFRKGIRQFFGDVTFDIVLYATPPITLYRAVHYVKKRDKAFCYLMLKDIFPQNAVDIHMLSTHGVRGFLYRYFTRLEKKLYSVSDKIGCMSEANMRYLAEHNPQLAPDVLGLLPNSIEPCGIEMPPDERVRVRKEYGLPTDKIVLVYGGNLGKPQDIPFVIECLKMEQNRHDVFYFIVGDGTDYPLLESYVNRYRPPHVMLVSRIPREEYDRIIAACDIGLIFLDHRFTIPNFPSRLLAYMQAGLPVVACTDENTDIGDVIEQGDFGIRCSSDSPESFSDAVHRLVENGRLHEQGKNAYEYLLNNYTASRSYEKIMESVYEISYHQHSC